MISHLAKILQKSIFFCKSGKPCETFEQNVLYTYGNIRRAVYGARRQRCQSMVGVQSNGTPCPSGAQKTYKYRSYLQQVLPVPACAR